MLERTRNVYGGFLSGMPQGNGKLLGLTLTNSERRSKKVSQIDTMQIVADLQNTVVVLADALDVVSERDPGNKRLRKTAKLLGNVYDTLEKLKQKRKYEKHKK